MARMPFRFIVKYLRRYGATVGENCRFERGIRIHRPLGKRPFDNLIIGNDVYVGHAVVLDLSCRISLGDRVIIATGSQVWTHSSYYEPNGNGSPQYKEKRGEVNIEDGAIVYSDVIISSGVTIGRLSQVGANSLVIKNVEPETFFAGNPAAEVKKSVQQ